MNDGQITEDDSISAASIIRASGFRTPWAEHARRVRYVSATDRSARGVSALCKLEHLPRTRTLLAASGSHAMKLAPKKPKRSPVVICMSGRGDKDIFTVADHLA